MFITNSIRGTSMVLIIILIILISLNVNQEREIFSADYNEPISNDLMSISTQQYISDLCEENEMSPEFVISIYHVEGIDNPQIEGIKKDIENLVHYRSYWDSLGVPSELVFDFILISRQRGLEACKIYFEENYYVINNDYVEKVAEYKYFLEQNKYPSIDNNDDIFNFNTEVAVI